MTTLFDACSLINLIKGLVFDLILDLPQTHYLVGSIVLQECSPSDEVADALARAVANGRIALLDDSQISGPLFLELIERYRLGPGETECLAFALHNDVVICSDDLKARRVATGELGEDRVIGTLGLLRNAVFAGVLSEATVSEAYERMKQEGGFLPNIDPGFFGQAGS